MLYLILLALLFAGGCSRNQDSGLAAEIASIKAIDNHAHPMRFADSTEKPDDEYDALTYEEMEPAPFPIRLRSENPEYLRAWQGLFEYKQTDVKQYVDLKQSKMKELGDRYPAWVLDQLGIETMFANRVGMGKGLAVPRFRWVPFDDALLFPLNNQAAMKETPDYNSFYKGEDRILRRYLKDEGLEKLPTTLEEYQSKVVIPTIEWQKKDGAVAIKFEAAYLRSLDFAEPDESAAAQIYAKYASGTAPPPGEYKKLQDYLFRYMAREAGRLGLAVHIHVCMGVGGYFKLAGANPVLLEPVFNDPSLRKTNFVLIHGGWPATKEAITLTGKPNVYTDFSLMTLLLYPKELATVIRQWLEYMPEKVMFGTDSTPVTPQVGWEETGWLASKTAREALRIALEGMLQDGEITRTRASELARMVMRDNAIQLYKLQ